MPAGEGVRESEPMSDSRRRLIEAHEEHLATRFIDFLASKPGVRIHGRATGYRAARVPTISFTVEGKRPEEVCRFLGERGIFAWDGHFYAIRAVEVLGLLEKGGVTRMGISAYTTEQEIDAVLKAVKALIKA